MKQKSLPAVFMRGGTSKALMLNIADLPAERDDWTPLFSAAMGTPDPYGRQLDGMGGGVSSLSKVCIIGPSSHPDADEDYTFAQVAIKEEKVDYRGKDRKSTRLNSSHVKISYAVFCLKKKKKNK